MAPKQLEFRPDVEGLRGIAVLLVVGFHAGASALSGGFIGVDIFFVISGYLITGLLVREFQQTGRIQFATFYARRARRLIPAATLMIVVTTIGGFALLSPYEAKELSKSALAAVLFSSNLWFIREAADYFAHDLKFNAALHTWSLGVEEQFYLFWPLLIFLALRGAAPLRRAVAAIAAVSAISFVSCVVLTAIHQPMAFFSMPTRAWQFGLGALACLVPWRLVIHQKHAAGAGWFGCALIVGAALALDDDSPGFPGVLAALPSLGAVAVLVSGEFSATHGAGRILASSPMQFVGRLSYAWYLWHWPALVFVYVRSPQPSAIDIVGAVLASLALALLTHIWLENPIRFSRYLGSRTGLSLSAGAVLTLFAGTVSVAAYLAAKTSLLAPEQRVIAEAAAVRERYTDCVVRALDHSVRECSFGDDRGRHAVILFGDSHAMQWLPALEHIAVEKGVRLITVNKTACPAPAVPVYLGVMKRRYHECESWRIAALQRIAEIRPLVVVTSSSVAYVKLHGENEIDPSLDEWRRGTRFVFERLAHEGIPVVMIRDNPIPGRDLAQCLSRAAWHHTPAEACSVLRSVALADEIFAAEKAAIADLDEVEAIDFSNEICGRDVCPAVKDGVIVYRDSNHLTETFVRSLGPMLEGRLGLNERIGKATQAAE